MMPVICQRPWQLARLLFKDCIVSMWLAIVAVPLHADELPASRLSFIELDSEIQAIKAEILAVNREILLLEEAVRYPQGEQLVVLVSIAQGSSLVPEQISLQLSGQPLSRHNYSANEVAALYQGGVHRLYTGRLSEGEHRLDITVSGRLGRGKDFQRQRSVTISKSPGRRTVELQLGPGDGKSKAVVTVREWQQ